MYTRIVTFPLKANSTADFAKATGNVALPLLRTHKGFLDQINLVTSDGKTGFGISFWDSKESAEAYSRSGFSEVMKALEKVTSGPPQVQLCEVTNSTVHKIAAARAA